MESQQQQHTKREGVSIIGALAGMLVTFIAGIYVGLHPSWVPIKGTGSAIDTSSLPGPTVTIPATAPTTR